MSPPRIRGARSPRIAMVSEHASPLAALGGADAGGQNVHVAELARGLARLGASVVIHTRRNDDRLPRRVKIAKGVVVDHVTAGPPAPVPKDDLLPHMGRFADDLRAVWSCEPPDLIHSHFWMSGHAAQLGRTDPRIPLVHTFHALGVVKQRFQGPKDTSPPERAAIERRLACEADHIVATCSEEVFELARLGAQRPSMSVVPCGVDTDLFTPDGPVCPRPQRGRRILVVSRLVERKGIGNVIEALRLVPDAELVIAGGPDSTQLGQDAESGRLLTLARDTGVAGRVHLIGRVARHDLPALYRSADAVVCAPWYEPFGIVPIEAMACGVPVVASAVGGLADTVVHGVTGLHVPPRDPVALARALTSLFADENVRTQFGLAGAARVRQRYRWDDVAAMTLEVYERLLAPEASTGHGWTRP